MPARTALSCPGGDQRRARTGMNRNAVGVIRRPHSFNEVNA